MRNLGVSAETASKVMMPRKLLANRKVAGTEYPTPMRTRARIGQVLGWTVVGLWVIARIARLGAVAP
jgi:hypothetical protein